jgi:pimeloyl-ACP methyl ester carboxylesterase
VQGNDRLDIVTSADGTRIAVHRRGEGPPLLLVHGALTDHAAWARVAPLLDGEHELLMPDRRGRGLSGDAAEYKYEREVDDLFAVSMGMHTDVDICGHSSGAILALRALERGLPVRRAVLYEPPLAAFRPDGAASMFGLEQALRQFVAAGDRDGAVTAFLRDAALMPAGQVERLRSGAGWTQMTRLAHTLAYDAEIAAGYVLEARRLRSVRTPVLMLAGSASPAWMHTAAAAVAAGLPDARVVELVGQEHGALVAAPRLLADTILPFLT